MKAPSHSLLFLCSLPLAGVSNGAFILDDFDTNTSADYIVVDDSSAASGDNTPDGTVTFAYDYSSAGIPSAPGSDGGSTSGLRISANDTSTDAGASDHYTIYHTLPVLGSYRVSVDMYMRVASGASGTTEFANVGIGGASNDFNSIFTPIAGNGQFVSITGDGGSSSDYRHYSNGTPVVSSDPSYLNSTNTTNANGDTYQTIFPGGDYPGSPGNRWTTLTIDVIENGDVTYSLDGTPIIQTPTTAGSGLVGLGYADVFSSVSGPDTHFVVFDNLSVEQIVPEPTSALLSLTGLVVLLRRRR